MRGGRRGCPAVFALLLPPGFPQAAERGALSQSGRNIFRESPPTPTTDESSVLDFAEYLEAAMEDGDPAVIATAIGNIARAKG